jgi:DNA (cytosine-5)-methyltransferase 1
MNGLALYNEIDPYTAEWIRNLISAGLIAPGIVDERSIEDLEPAYVRQFTQFHTCAGIAVWSLALRAVGWPDSRPVWTGSYPCQPFSEAGKGLGFADERHIWPAGYHLKTQCMPPVVFGEQSASPAGMVWLDLVQTDLEALGYAFGAVPFPSAGVGAPHIRDRSYWVAHTDDDGREPWSRGQSFRPERDAKHGECFGGMGYADDQGPQGHAGNGDGGRGRSVSPGSIAPPRRLGGLAHPHNAERWADAPGRHERDGTDAGWTQGAGDAQGRGELVELADASCVGRRARLCDCGSTGERRDIPCDLCVTRGVADRERPGPVNGFWRDSDWLFCRDGKWRPVRPDSFPLAHGVANRAAQLRAYGNAINLEAAKAFILSTGLI